MMAQNTLTTSQLVCTVGFLIHDAFLTYYVVQFLRNGTSLKLVPFRHSDKHTPQHTTYLSDKALSGGPNNHDTLLTDRLVSLDSPVTPCICIVYCTVNTQKKGDENEPFVLKRCQNLRFLVSP
jgi:hypothetical protein